MAGEAVIGSAAVATLSFGLNDFGLALVAAVLGMAAKIAFEAGDKRTRHLNDPVKYPSDGNFDLKTFVLAATGAPLIAMVALSGCRAIKFIPDGMVLPIVGVMGYWGKGGVDVALSALQDVISKRTK